MSAKHGDQTAAKGIHVLQAFTFADSAARTGASGLTVTDHGKVAQQTDDSTYYILQATTPVTWIQVGGGGAIAKEFLQITNDSLVTSAAVTSFGGQMAFATSDYPSATDYVFEATGQMSNAGLTMNVGLFNLTNTEFVAGSTLVFSTTVPTLKQSTGLTTGSSSGNLRTSSTVYEVRQIITGGAGETSIGTLGTAYLTVE